MFNDDHHNDHSHRDSNAILTNFVPIESIGAPIAIDFDPVENNLQLIAMKVPSASEAVSVLSDNINQSKHVSKSLIIHLLI